MLVLLATSAHAQSADPPAPRAHHVTLSAGALWSAPYSIGDSTATLRSNAPGATPPPFTLFNTSSTIDSAPGVVVRAGFALTPSITIEAAGSFSGPSLTSKISQDSEGAAAVVESESLQQFVIEACAVWYLPVSLGPRFRLFASGGGGYLRQLHQERTLVETGRVLHAGTGVSFWLHGGHGTGKSLGLRSDLRANWRQDGIEFDGQTRAYPTVTMLVFVGL